MKPNHVFGLALACLLVVASRPCFSQEVSDTTLYHVETTDGNQYSGLIIESTPTAIKIRTQQLGEITLLRSNIKVLEAVTQKQMVKGNFWLENPQATRYFWEPNGYGLKAGEAYYQNVWVLFNQMGFGLTDEFSIGAGLVPLFLFAGSVTPVWITPKFSIPVEKDKVNVGAGALAGTVLGTSKSGFGIAYGMLTLGSRDKNVSIGLGYGYTGQDGFGRYPAVTFSGIIRTGPRGYLMTENYYLSGVGKDVILFTVGGRQLFKGAGLDYGLVIPAGADIGTFLAIPWLGITIPFDSRPKDRR